MCHIPYWVHFILKDCLVNLANTNPFFLKRINTLHHCAGIVWLSLFVFLDLCVCVPKMLSNNYILAQFIHVLQPFFGHIRQGRWRWRWRCWWWFLNWGSQLVWPSVCTTCWVSRGESPCLRCLDNRRLRLLRLPFSSS